MAVALLGGCYDYFGEDGNLSSEGIPRPNITIAQLCEMLESESLLIYDDIVARGVVTSSDKNGNFYKTFVVEQDGSALEVMEGKTDSYSRHDIGSVVTIRLKGLMVAKYRGVYQVGRKPSPGNYYTLDYIEAEQLLDQHIFNNYKYTEAKPVELTIGELTEEMCGRLVRIKSLKHTPAEGDTQPYIWRGYQQFVNNFDDSIYCSTSEYANFSLMAIPREELYLTGILQYGAIYGLSGKHYIIEMRGVYDCEVK